MREMVSHYEILEKLGEGGAGIVYKARDLLLDRFVALKFLRPELLDSEETLGRFLREARAISALNHPHIATIYSVEEEEGRRFLALEFLPGGTLQARIRQAQSAGTRLPLPEVVRYGLEIAEGLAHAHRHGILHRDVKPANVLFTGEGAAKLVDFGLARRGAPLEDTTAGRIAGTIPYMSPEQAQCGDLDHRTDIFSLGVILYEMASGERPFQGPAAAAVLDEVVHRPTPSLKLLCPESPEALEQIVHRATAKKRDERYQSAEELAADLRSLAGPGAAPPEPGWDLPTVTVPRGAGPLPSKTPLRARAVSLVAAGALLLVALAAIFSGRISDWLHPLPAEKQIAVLPFTNVGEDPANRAFCDGLMETVTAKLGQVEQFHGSLRVVPATEVRGEKVTSAYDARRRFGVNLALSGSVQRFGDSVRLTVNLLDAVTRSQLRSDTIDARLGDLASLQDGVFIRASAMLELELHPEARKLLSAGETSVPSAYYLYVQTLGHLAQHDRAEDVERAIGLFLQALHADPNYALASAGAGEAYWRKFHLTKDPASIEEARKYCARALELNSGLAQAHVLLGLIQTGTGRYDDGVTEFQRALKLDPINASALRGLARSYEQQGRREEAEAAYQKAVQLRPRDWAGYRELGVFYHRLGRLPDAERCFLRVIELAPDSYLGYRNLGGLYWLMGRFDDAIRQTQKSLAILPTAPAYSNLGGIYFLQGRYQDASAMYEKALALGAADERLIWGNLAESYRVSGRRGKAAEAYRQAIRLAERDLAVNPRHAELRASLALYMIGISDTQRALTEIGQARKLAPESWTVLFRAALVYEMAGRRDEALQALEGALKQGCPIAEVQKHPDLAELRRDPRYAALPGSPGATTGK